jgi:hypothetical protein
VNFIHFAFLALGLEAVLLFFVFLGDLKQRMPEFWFGLCLAFCIYLIASRYVWRGVQWKVGWILAAALLFRLTLLPTEPSLSDDVYRYLWDGKVQLVGINPYLLPPASEELLSLRDELWTQINHKDVSTIYPPLSQILFRLICSASPTVFAMKAIFTIFDCAIILLLAAILRARNEDPRRLLLYAWNPLPVVEIAGSGHLDTFGVFLLLSAFYFLAHRQRAAAAWTLAGAFMAKLLPILVLPILWRDADSRWSVWKSRLPLIWFPVGAAVALLVYADAGRGILAGLQVFLAKWRFNDAVFSLLYAAIKEPGLDPDDAALYDAKLLCGGLLVAIIVWALVRRPDPLRAAATILGANLLLSPVLHPWYMVWVLPFQVFFPVPAWLFLSGSVFLSYNAIAVYSATGAWVAYGWVKWIQFAPFFMLLILYPVYRRGRKNP